MMESDIRSRLTQALQHHGQGRLDAAEKLYREVLQQEPGNPDALNLLGVMKHQRGDAAAAEELILRAVAGKSDVAGYWNNLGNVQAAQGKMEEAAKAYERAVTLQPDDALALINLGFILKNLGQIDSAIEKYRRAVALQPNFAEAHGKLGVALTQAEKLAEAAEHFHKALALKPDYVEARASLGNILRAQGALDEAARHYEQVLAAQPEFAEIHFALGMVRRQQAKPNEAAECFRRAIKIRRDYAEAHHNLGDIRMEQGRLDEARKCYKRALEADPEYPEALSHLGIIMRRRGAVGDAVANFERALKLKPDFAEAMSNLGIALLDMGKRDAGELYLVRALELRPNFPEGMHNLGLLRYLQNRLDDAEMLFLRALALRPDFAEAHNNLATILKDKGRLQEAMDHCRRALEIQPDYADAHTTLIFTLDFDSAAGFVEHQAERRRWFERFGKGYAAVARRYPHDRDPERRLRIGYVSGDFRQHSAVYSFGPVLRNHERARFEVTAYSTAPNEDSVTADLKTHVDHWRPVLGMLDEELAAMIRADKIDILVDLSGHSHGNRLLVFSRKPAPVQVTAWGHATGTGVRAIDYLFSDPVTVPAEARAHFAEGIYDLPCAIGYEAPAYAPGVAPLPVSQGHPLTFGSLNRLSKVSAATLTLWARLLLLVPGTRLLLKDRQLNSEMERGRILAAFAAQGIGAERIELQGGSSHAAHLAAFAQIDIALDPFPQNGGISTMEALWMGVPVVARLGNSPSSRIAAAILTAAGLPDWVAADDDAYVAIAQRKAADVEALAALRSSLRTGLSERAVGNPRLYTRAVEDAYRAMWRRWCAGKS